MTIGAFNYAQADRSDPFAYAKAMSHIKNGICDQRFDNKNNEQRLCHYEADLTQEQRSFVNGEGKIVEYTVPTYVNMKRP